MAFPRGLRITRQAAAVLAAALPCMFIPADVLALPTFTEVRAAHRPSDITLLDRHGVPLQTVRVDRNVRRLAWLPLTEMSPALLQTIVVSEDQRFYAHSGVD